MNTIIIFVFIFGYAAIVMENIIKVNKAASALLTGVLCWTLYIVSSSDPQSISSKLMEQLGEISGILFFLMGAMTVVELIASHNGFEIISNLISSTNKRKLLWIICFLTFFLSAVLDNLTTTIVMISLLRKLISDKNDKMLFAGMVIIAANAGGAWSPIGDVTTTMLWIGGQVTSMNIILKLFLPSLVCLLIPLVIVSFTLKGNVENSIFQKESDNLTTTPFERNAIFFFGLGVLFFVPLFKSLTHLPPFMGMLSGLGLIWLFSEFIHKNKEDSEKGVFTVLNALKKIDMPSILFFLGILISIAALQSTGILSHFAVVMNDKIGNISYEIFSIGFLSAVVDNVPLVGGAMGMYDLNTFPVNHFLWEFLSYCAGTGGSLLVIGSASGIAAMGMERIEFFWYLKRISWLALLGYLAGALTYMTEQSIIG